MTMDLENLTPAPWRVSDCHGLCVVRDDPIADVVCELSVGQWTGNREDADFIALARNAFAVMMRRGWVPVRGETTWYVLATELPTDIAHGDYADPFTALVEADKWIGRQREKHDDRSRASLCNHAKPPMVPGAVPRRLVRRNGGSGITWPVALGAT